MIDYATLTPEAMANMSDEEFAKLDPSQIPDTTVSEPTEEEVVEPETTPEAEEVPEEETTNTPPFEEGASNESANGVASEAEQTQAADVVTQQPDETQQPNQEEQAQDTPAEVSAEKAFFDKVTGGFTANGKEYKIDNADDAVRLMQMGLNYNQKMAAMKPNMKMVRALQDAGIQSVEDLGFLLDLQAKKPEAIAKLVQESGIDEYDFESKAKDYVPSVPNVSDQTIEFEAVAQSLESNPHFNTVVQHLGGFDNQTKQAIFNNPHMLHTLTNHVETGLYDKIIAQYEIASALGQTAGMSFLDAYDKIGNAIFNQTQAQNTQTPVNTAPPAPKPVPVPVAQKSNTVNNTARQAAASAPNTAPQSNASSLTPKDIWEMSDEDFAKIDPKFLK